MEQEEVLKIFDENRDQIGMASREEVHRLGYWHETFHCWLYSKDDGVDYLYLQIRSGKKKDYPNLLDITAAGHLLAGETVNNGIRELKEELGSDVSFHELISLGITNYCARKEGFIDNEIAHVFLYECKHTFDEFNLQVDEVSGIVRVEFDSFYDIWTGAKDEIQVEGFEIDQDGEKVSIDKFVRKNHFVPHSNANYKQLAEVLRKEIKGI